ncbi:hydrogenase 3 maturation endopeptidase HyCI [Candidatus Bathyarchaeota archaeon]|nr:hydrogenase 3 maturation endopeptidase HyCI [Candidatus Bathyarchaeota archaeon]
MRQIPELENMMIEWFKGAERIVIVGIGNELRRDDFVGVRVVKDLREKVPEHVMLIESETVPESYIDEIVEFNPSHILLIDAGMMGCEPGAAKFIHYDTILKTNSAVSTHSLPLRVFCDYLNMTLRTKIALLIVQPENAGFGEGLNKRIEEAASELKTALLRILQRTKVNKKL